MGQCMDSDSLVDALKKIKWWAESIQKQKAYMTVDENPAVNQENFDYIVDYEIVISPKNPDALPLTIWLSGDAIGFFVGDFSIAARLSNSKVSKVQSSFACAGMEPVFNIDIDAMLSICDSIATARLEMTGVVVLGKLKGLHTKIDIGDNQSLSYSVGQTLILSNFLSVFGIAKKVQIPCFKW